MIRVLHFAAVINRHDFIDAVLTRLDRQHFHVSALVGVLPQRIAPYQASDAYPTRCLHLPFARRHYRRMLRALIGEIRRTRPHIVHAHHYDENLVTAIAARLTRIPCYIFGRHYSDLLYVLSYGMRRRIFLAAEAFANRTATRIIVPADEVERLLVDRQGVPAEKVVTIPYGLDPGRLQPSSPGAPSRLRREHGIGERDLIVACGRLNREKGLDYLLHALPLVGAQRPGVRAVIVGDGPEAHRLTRLAAELEVDDIVRFVGWRPDAVDWIAAADVFVQPSISDTRPQTVMEALGLSTPVVMTSVGFAREALGDDERGRIVPPRSGAALATAILELLNDPGLRRRLAAAGRTHLGRTADPDHVARRHEELYRAALEGPGSRAS